MADVLGTFYQALKVRQGTSPSSPGFVVGEVPSTPVNPPGTFTNTFITLTDAPKSYSGQAGKVVAVKSDETGLEFITGGGGGLTLSSPLTGYVVGSNTALTASNTVLQGFQNLQGQVNARVSGTGTTNFVPKFTASGTIGSSTIFESANGEVGIGSSTVTNYSLRLAKQITGAVVGYGVTSEGQVRSDVTSSVRYFQSNLNLQSTTFNLGEAYHFLAGQALLSGGATIGAQYGFYASSNLTGATNNFGFRGDINAGTGRWNLYMLGTANNYLAGSLWIGTTSGTDTLDINGTLRVRTVNALGTAPTTVWVGSATGVLSSRTLAEFAGDLGVGQWTLVGSGIFRNSQVSIGRTTLGGSTAALAINSLGTTSGFPIILGHNNAGTQVFNIDKDGNFGSNLNPTVNFEGTRNTSGNSPNFIGRQTNTAGFSGISFFNSSSAQAWIGITSPSYAASLGNVLYFGMLTTGTNIVISPNMANTSSTTERTIFRNGGFSSGFDVASFDINGLTFVNGKNVILGTTTGTILATSNLQKLGIWGATPIVQPTTGVAAGAFVANTSGIANDTATFAGYTIGQIVQALRNIGLLA